MISNELLQKIKERLVNAFHPQRIILFGSQARETADDRSDVDILVICSFEGKRRQLMLEMDRSLNGLKLARDVVILTPEEFERDGTYPAQLLDPPGWKEKCFMKTPNEEIFHKVRQWIDHADEDLRLATYALKMRGKARTFRLVAYHAQQCAEKYLKAYLVYRGVDFPYTHNISILLELCGEHADWPMKLKDAEELTSYVITTRYPGESEEVTKADADKAIKTAKQVHNQVREALKQLGFKLSN